MPWEALESLVQWGQASENVEESMFIYHTCLLRLFPQVITFQFQFTDSTYLQNLDIITEVLEQDCYIFLNFWY